jgi:hypothetical protein
VDGGEDSDSWIIRVGGSIGGVELTDSDGEESRLSGVGGDYMEDERARDIQSTGESSRFRPSSSTLSNSSSHLLFTAFLVCLADGGVVSDGEGADGGARVWMA